MVRAPVGDGADGADLGEVGHLPAGGGHGQVEPRIKNERNFAQTKGSDWVRQGSPWFGIHGSSGSGRVVANSQRMIGARSNLTGSVARVSEGWGAPFDQLSSCQIIWTGRGQE